MVLQLQKLLSSRNEAFVLYRSWAYCSCGSRFAEFSEAENHLVSHERVVATDAGGEDPADLDGFLMPWLQSLRRELISRGTAASVQLPDNVVAVVPEEPELGSGRAMDVQCCECLETRPSFQELKEHFESAHPGRWLPRPGKSRVLRSVPANRMKGLDYRFYCPIPGCSNHLLSSKGGSKYVKNMSLLKQHYLKVHAAKTLQCGSCPARFSCSKALGRHQKVACGKTFRCVECGRSYSGLEHLQTHCRRKGHRLPPDHPSRKKVQPRPPPSVVLARAGRTSGQPPRGKGFLPKIAPKPCPVQLSAAIALSELSRDQQAVRQKASIEGLVKIFVDGGRKPTTTTSTSAILPQLESATVEAVALEPARSVQEQETQTRKNGSECRTVGGLFPGDLVTGIWITAATQTSPKKPDTHRSSSPPLAAVASFRDLMLSTEIEGTSLAGQGATISPMSKRPPRIGEIEQYSTETQTDEFDDVLMNKRAAVHVSSDDDDDPFSLKIEATTQFDLDDILCSNYTQTCSELGSDIMLLHPLVEEASTVETQTTFSSSILDPSLRYLASRQTKSSSDVSGFANMETQTGCIGKPRNFE